MDCPHAHFVRCSLRGRSMPFGRPGGEVSAPTLTSFAAPHGGSVPFGRPGGEVSAPTLTSFAAPHGGSVPFGRPGGH
jgi:hypothetical protein